MVQQHPSCAVLETCMEVWERVAGRAGVVVSVGSSSGSRLPPSAVSKHCPEDGEGDAAAVVGCCICWAELVWSQVMRDGC